MTVTRHPARRSLAEQDVLVLQHIRCEPPGVYEDVLRAEGARTTTRPGIARSAADSVLPTVDAGENRPDEALLLAQPGYRSSS